MKTKKNGKKFYAPPSVERYGVALEAGIAGNVVSIQTREWVPDETIGDDSSEGGDIYLPW
ncbi:MAG: hypothetical protein LBH19_05200 [Dysgonamonadaceae bacterium]|jgi:hypothetical protein|nr:hypothetical protein [Dysgonamonadaceae bacterium]